MQVIYVVTAYASGTYQFAFLQMAVLTLCFSCVYRVRHIATLKLLSSLMAAIANRHILGWTMHCRHAGSLVTALADNRGTG